MFELQNEIGKKNYSKVFKISDYFSKNSSYSIQQILSTLHNYFTIYSDQYFKYDKYNDPKIIIEGAMKNDVLKSSENKCYKSKKDGIYLG